MGNAEYMGPPNRACAAANRSSPKGTSATKERKRCTYAFGACNEMHACMHTSISTCACIMQMHATNFDRGGSSRMEDWRTNLVWKILIKAGGGNINTCVALFFPSCFGFSHDSALRFVVFVEVMWSVGLVCCEEISVVQLGKVKH